eukprot:2792466-Alexandrium_andersonii.AAC.1
MTAGLASTPCAAVAEAVAGPPIAPAAAAGFRAEGPAAADTPCADALPSRASCPARSGSVGHGEVD